MAKPKKKQKDPDSFVVHVRMDAALKAELDAIMTAEHRPSLNNTIVSLLLEAIRVREAKK